MATLTQVYEATIPGALHVVFVHGLGGDARSTWMHNSKDHTTLWPNWIGKDAECNVWVAGYDAALSGWTNAAMHLTDLGEALFAALQVERGLQERRIVLVGHSLGGLVIKSGMTQAQVLGDPQRLLLLERIAGVVFIGTPHQGSGLASVADTLRFLLRTNPQVTNMASNDAWLKLLNGQFRALHKQRSFSVRVFFESKGILLGCRILGLTIGRRKIIVDRNSSDPGIAEAIPTAIEGDHFEIAKPKSRHVFIHKALVDFLRGVPGGPTEHLRINRTHPIPTSDLPDLPTILRNASAPLLSWPSTLPDGTWLQRPELDVLTESLLAESSSTHFLLGDPGCGKSSLLVRLAQEKQKAGWHVLAIKADRLPPDVLDHEALARHLNLGADVSVFLRELAKSRPVLVLIDQVDALADLVVQHSARLRVLLDLVRHLSNVENIHTVISCRTFEQKHDPALRNLDATVIRMELPEWSSVQPVLEAKGLQAEIWNQDIQQVLRSPHALDIFLSLLGDVTEPDVLRSFQGLLEKQWETQVLSDTSGKRRATLRHLAKMMAEREVLGLPLAQVENYYQDIQELTAAGLLRVNQGPGRVEFRHQTLYEFVRARSFLEESGSLTETVQKQQGSLRIRPQLWHALGYFRGASPEEYGIEIERLWNANLRPHLKMLLIEFLGLQAAPSIAERRLVEKAINDQWFFPRFIGAAVGSPGWFAILSSTHLPRLMSLPKEQAQMPIPMLRHALHFNANSVVELVHRYWLPDKDKDILSWQVLGSGEVVPQIGYWLDSTILIAGRTQIAEWAIEHLASVVSASLPEEAPRLIAAWFERKIDFANTSSTVSCTGDEVATANTSKGIQSVLEARKFRDLKAISEAAPRAFVEALWPLLLKGLELCTLEAPRVIISYCHSGGLLFPDLDDEETRNESPLLRSIQLGIQGWAASDPESFMDFVAANARCELLLVHRFLAIGLVRAVVHSPHRAFDYLLGDPRRMVLGPYNDVHKESVALVEAICPLLDDNAYAVLEAALLNWHYYNDTARQDDAGTRHRRLQWARQHRLRLLRALSASRRSPVLQRLVDEEERAFPRMTGKDVHFSGFQCIGSPVSAAQMDRASDANVLNLFNELTDESAWDHPRHHMKGGALQAGRELAGLAKNNLAKVLRIIRALDPTRNEIPVSCVLSELIPAGFTAPALYSLIIELEDKGFVGTGFRRDAAYAIAKATNKEAPVPDELIDRMERWLVPNLTENSNEIEADAKDSSSSILWESGRMRALPNGNYPVLSALTSACLTAESPRVDRWLSIIERHVARVESSRVWEAMIQYELRHLQMVDCSRAEALIDYLMASVPSIVGERGWTHFVARAFRWVSATAARRWLMATVELGEKGLQGAGELAVLRHALFPAEDWSRELVGVLGRDTSSAAALGIAHSVANLWHEPMTKPVVHSVLLQLVRSNDDRILTALSAIFINGGITADAETRELLDALVAFPAMLKNGRGERLPELVAKLVAFEPTLVCQVAHAILNTAGDQMGNITTSWYLSTEWLLDIALQLQDMGAAERVAGSILFERMLEFNMPQAREMTLELDKRTPVRNIFRAPTRRRSKLPH